MKYQIDQYEKHKEERREKVEAKDIPHLLKRYVREMEKDGKVWQMKTKIGGREVILRNPDRKAILKDLATILGYGVI